jgi:FAD/FMN-containing dehydrogenase
MGNSSLTQVEAFCSQLQKAGTYKGKILRPGQEEYTQYRYRWNARSDLGPPCIVVPFDLDSIVLVVKIANITKMEIAVQCGGHHISNQASTKNGILLHMSNFDRVSVNEDRKTITFGGGCLWSHVYGALVDTKWEVVGGGVHNVGVGGYLTGGGESFPTLKLREDTNGIPHYDRLFVLEWAARHGLR